jgi:hypothetical protein
VNVVGSLRRDLALAVNAAGQGGAGQSAEELELLASGGLSQLVAELRRSFSFGSPSLEMLDGKPLIAVVGRWRSEALKRQWQSLSPDDPGGWPSHLPHHVVVKIGRDDFFPYAIEYRRASDAAAIASVTGVSDPLARFEFFDVRWGVHMEPRLFEFTPAEVDWRDVTAAVLEQLRPASPAAAAQPLAQREGAWRK